MSFIPSFPSSQGKSLTTEVLGYLQDQMTAIEKVHAENEENIEPGKSKKSTFLKEVAARVTALFSAVTAAVDAALYHPVCAAVKLATAPFGHAAHKLGLVEGLSANFGFKEAGNHVIKVGALGLHAIAAAIASIFSPQTTISAARKLGVIQAVTAPEPVAE